MNPGFETGNLSGWTVTTGLSNRARLPVLSEADLLIASGGTNLSSAKTGNVMSLVPPGLTAADGVRYPRYGRGAAVVNELGKNRNVNRLIQTAVITPKDIDPHDGKVHVRFVVLPVMQNPGHVIQEQPYYFVSVSNLTRGTTLASRFNFSNESGVPWRSNRDGSVVYTDWLLFDLPIGPADAAVGDTLEVRVIAGGCQPTGHWGHAIVDAFGTTIPGLAVFAAGPQSVAAGSDYQYRYRVNNGGGEVANGGKLTIHLPADTTFRSVDTPGVKCNTPVVGVRGSITCEVPSVPAGGYFDVRLTVRADATASSEIRHGWYTVESQRETALVGPLVTTQVTPPGSTHYVDLSTRVTNGQPALEWGQPVLYAVTVRNVGPATATDARIASNAPSELTDVSWTCSPSAGAECGALSGSGALDTTATLPPNTEVSYTVSANVAAGSGPGQVSYRVVAQPPLGSTEQHPDDNGDADTDPVNTLRTVTLQKTGGGTGRLVATPGEVQCGAGCTQTTGQFAEGTSVAFHAVADAGSRFAGWSGSCAGTELSCSLTVAPGQTITASFEPNPIAISSPLTATAAVGVPFEYTLTAIGQYTGLDATGHPDWLGYDPVTSKLTGTAPAAGTFNVTLSVTDGTVTRNETLVVTAGIPPRITSALTFTLTGSTTAWTSVSVSATGTGPIHYNASNLPGLVAFNSTNGAFSGSAGATGTFNVPVVAQNAFGSDYKIIAVSIGGAPRITSPLVAAGTVGTPFSYTLTATGSPTPTRSMTQLPEWAEFDPTTGVLSGTPTSAGTFSIGLRATNTSGTSQQALVLTVDGPAVITSGLTASATVGTPFSYTLTAEGTAPISRAVTGRPAWLTFDEASGILSGTPTAPGTFSIGLAATNGIGGDARILTLTVSLPPPPPSPPAITSALAVNAVVGEPFSYTATATGLQPITWSATGLPSWATWNPTTRTISGTPTGETTLRIALEATNVLGADQKELVIRVYERPKLDGPTTATAVVTRPFILVIRASGADRVLTADGLPSWAEFNAATGTISGTPDADGVHTVTVEAVNPVGHDSHVVVLTVITRPQITSAAVADAVTGQAFSYTLTATGTSPRLSADNLPGWASFDPATGIISGVPDVDGDVLIDLEATNAAGGEILTLTIAVRTPPHITSDWQADAVVGQPFSYNLTATGTAPTLSVHGLPSWATFNATTGVISGVPDADGVLHISTHASNPAGDSTQVLVLTVRALPQITSPLTGDAVVGMPFAFGVTATGTSPVLTVTGLPSWASYDGAGVISGTPDADGTHSVTVRATNPAGEDVQTLVITARTAPQITSPWEVDAVVGQAFSYTVTASGTEPTLSVHGMPHWASFDTTTGVISGVPDADGVLKLSLRATNPAGDYNQALVVTVRALPQITSPLTGDAVVGMPFAFGVTATGTEPVLTVSGLPSWASYDGAGVISGTPDADGTHPVTVRATNPAGEDVQTLVLTVRTVPRITSALTANAVVGQSFSYTLTATGTQPTLSATGLPSWATFSEGRITGTPIADGTHPITLRASNPAGEDVQTLHLTVRTVPEITSPLLVDAVVGQPFTYVLTATGTSPVFSVSGLPSWATFNDGVISGTPRADRNVMIILQATNPAGLAQETLLITVRAVPQITSALTAEAVVGQPFSYALTATGTEPTLLATGLPSWATFSDGRITGTPTADGTHAIALSATNPAGEDLQTLVLTVRTTPRITSALAVDAVVGQSFSYALTASGTEPTLLATGLPSWANFIEGSITGTPTEDGVHGIQLRASNGAGEDMQTLVLTVRALPQITSPLVADAVVGRAFLYTLTASGTEPALAVSGQPSWATFDAATGALTGTPTEDGTFTVQLSATNPAGASNESLTLTVRTAPQIASALVAHAATGSPFRYTLTATGSSPIALGASGLPAGLTYADGEISGIPTVTGTFSITLTAQNAADTDTQTLQLEVRGTVSAPGVGSPAPGESLNDDTPTLTGTTSPDEAGGTITVAGPGGETLCTATIAQDGTWSCTLPPLAEGPHTVTVRVTDPNGVPGTQEQTVSFEIDVTAPALPVWSTPDEDAHLNDPSPLLSGTAEPLAGVRVFDGQDLVCSTSADAAGLWSCLPLQPLAEGAHTLTLRALDEAGNVSPGAGRDLVIDLTAPSAPALQQPLDGAHISSPTPTLTGQAEPGSEVTVRIDGEVVCVVIADVDGRFICRLNDPLPDGPHSVSITTVDAAGNESDAGQFTFTVDTVNPPTPELSQPLNGESIALTQPQYTGTGEPHSTVTVLVDGTLACSAVVAEDGTWSCTQPFPLADGPHTVSLTATDRSGRPSAPGTSGFIVDTLAPAAPVNQPVGEGDITSTSTPRFSGTAEPHSTVDVYVDGELVCTAQADSQGTWFCTSTVELPDGRHEVTVVSRDAAGNVSDETTSTFEVDTEAPAKPVVSAPRTDGGLVTDAQPTFGGTAEPGSEVTVRVDGEVVCTAVADASGAWTCTPSEPIAPGPHTVTIEVKDAAGNTSEFTGTFDVRLERGELDDPTAGGTPGSSTNNGKVGGKATPGATVVIYVDGVEVGRTEADENGDWSFTLPLLDGGDHTLEIGVLDDTGREVHRTQPTQLHVRKPEISLGGGVGCASTGGGSLSLMALLFAGAALLRARRVARVLPVVALAVASVGVLAAGEAKAQPRVEGFELEQLSWNPAANGGMLVGGADLGGPGQWRVSASLGYQNSPLKYFEDGVNRATLVEHRWTTVFGGAYAVTRRLELGGWVPVIAYQNGATLRSELGEVVVSPVGRGMGLGTPWLQGRYGLLFEADGAPFDLGVGLGVGLPFGSRVMLARNQGFALAPRVGAGKRLGATRVALELGGVVGPQAAELLTELDGGAVDRIGSRLEAGLGVTSLGQGLRGELSARLHVPLAGQAPNVEVLAGVRYPIAGMQVFALAGPGFGNSPGTPAVRAIAGVSFEGGKRDICRADGPYPIELCPHLDADRDGVPNGDDACPTEPGPGQADGCPVFQEPAVAPAPEPVAEEPVAEEPVVEELAEVPAPEPVEAALSSEGATVGATIELQGKVHFNTGKSTIQTRSHRLLRDVAKVLAENPQIRVLVIEGHTDSRGSAALNRKLSEARAKAVRDFLAAEGVDASRLDAQGFGPDRPVADNATAKGREENRRVEFRIAEVE